MKMTRQEKNLRDARAILLGKLRLIIDEQLEAERVAGHRLDRSTAKEAFEAVRGIFVKIHTKVILYELYRHKHSDARKINAEFDKLPYVPDITLS
jgi:hypothetical protein